MDPSATPPPEHDNGRLDSSGAPVPSDTVTYHQDGYPIPKPGEPDPVLDSMEYWWYRNIIHELRIANKHAEETLSEIRDLRIALVEAAQGLQQMGSFFGSMNR